MIFIRQFSLLLVFSLIHSSSALYAKPAPRVIRKIKPRTVRYVGTAQSLALPLKYSGAIKLSTLESKIKLTANRGDVTSEYKLKNPGNKAVNVKLSALRPGFGGMSVRKPGKSKSKFSAVSVSKMATRSKKSINSSFQKMQTKVLDIGYSKKVDSIGKLKSFMYSPSLFLNDKNILQKLDKHEVTFELPSTAKHIVASTIPLSSVKRTNKGLIAVLSQTKAYPLPFSIKWTEHDVNVKIRKGFIKKGGREIKVNITVVNNSNKQLSGLKVEDSYSSSAISKATPADRWSNKSSGPEERRVFSCGINLPPNSEHTVSYNIFSNREEILIPQTKAFFQNSLVGVSATLKVSFPEPPPPPKCAVVLPSGWSFNYKNGDHHINEMGIQCQSQLYKKDTDTISWQTHCVHGDVDFNDPYDWSVAHDILRFQPGYVRNSCSGWINSTKKGENSHSGVYTNKRLVAYDHVVILLRGWKFDYKKGDHHINKIGIRTGITSFNRKKGQIQWKTLVTYGDRDFNDSMRYQYWYTIFAFNGSLVRKTFSGTSDGAATAHAGSVQVPELQSKMHGMAIPTGWSFDYKSSDHHVDQTSFKLQNVKYNAGMGKFTWTACMNFTDKNKKFDYDWSYSVALIATNDGEKATFNKGPYNDNGGAAQKNYTVSLKSIFKPVTWTNGHKDGDETGVDCGGSSPARDLKPCKSSVSPGNGPSSSLFCLKNKADLDVLQIFGMAALVEYAEKAQANFDQFYSGPAKADHYVEAVAHYVEKHMDYQSDGGSWKGPQSAIRTIMESGHRGSKDFAGDCEDFAILRASLLRALGFSNKAIFCADHHNSKDQGHLDETYGDHKSKNGHSYNIVVYRGKYRIMDYGDMSILKWAPKINPDGTVEWSAWDQHVTDNIWNDHTGKYWKWQNVTPFEGKPLVNYPGNPCSPSPQWNWRTYFGDITP